MAASHSKHQLHVEEYGPEQGEPVFLLHHGLGSTRSWKEQIPAMSEAGLRVIVYDRWGYGKSDPRPRLDVPDFKDDLDDLARLLDQSGLERAALVGHSDGGTIALYFAAGNPRRVTKIVTIAAHIYFEPKMLPGIEGIHYTYDHDPDFQRKFARQHGTKAEDVFNHWYYGWKKPEHLSWDMRSVIPRISCPTLVIQGSEDEHATPQHARDIASLIPQAELWLLPGAGHMLPQDFPEAFNSRVIRFLCEVPQGEFYV
jgi:pimeloyl-ACP methyl ester carboxylesterase